MGLDSRALVFAAACGRLVTLAEAVYARRLRSGLLPARRGVMPGYKAGHSLAESFSVAAGGQMVERVGGLVIGSRRPGRSERCELGELGHGLNLSTACLLRAAHPA